MDSKDDDFFKEEVGGEDHGGKGGLRWLLTYADMITLLLIFFVALYAMSETNSKKMEIFVKTLQKGFKVDLKQLAVTKEATSLDDAANLHAQSELSIKEKMFNDIFKKLSGLTDYGVNVVSTEKGIVIKVENTRFFKEGKAELTEDAKLLMKYIGRAIKKVKNPIVIEGHTDIVPIKTEEFPSNWELSTMRAVKVLRYLVEKEMVKPERVSAAGYGPYVPVAPNDLFTGNPLNRRVEIVILNFEPEKQNKKIEK
ncbi:MAG: flagellar motor protein MotB [Nitrospinae bacterium]|nr:flagellar motor protein MotB [Nitrospinota bacterium]